VPKKKVGKKRGEATAVRIADLSEAGTFAGWIGYVYGMSVPSSSGVGPIIGEHHGDRHEDLAYSVYFPETGEQEWFAPHLLEAVPEP